MLVLTSRYRNTNDGQYYIERTGKHGIRRWVRARPLVQLWPHLTLFWRMK